MKSAQVGVRGGRPSGEIRSRATVTHLNTAGMLHSSVCEAGNGADVPEFEATSSRILEDSKLDAASVSTEVSQYDASKHSPVFYGQMVAKVSVDTSLLEHFNPEYSHPALLGHAVVKKPPPPLSPPPPPPESPPDQKTCSPRQYLEHYVFPVLLPGLFETLTQAKKEKCFERKRTKFNACDFLAEWLYNNNQSRSDKKFIAFFEIPFVKNWLQDHPRPPIPLSLLLSEDEAALVIQSFWRGYRVRCDSEIQELRQWQRELREENRGYTKKIIKFWAEQESKVGQKMDEEEVEESMPTPVEVPIKAPTPYEILLKVRKACN
ncbi:IQ domain-containing protein K isoform X2 [Pristis pectinata]|uniref:IQ domain-containing protein K isoform X2 n=1 Tax=Pristis pectinata TaxID=685728 RepID=UPI00223DED13|nr:IQ domain-containing protein K isoform X2 [Pristis pectinata]